MSGVNDNLPPAAAALYALPLLLEAVQLSMQAQVAAIHRMAPAFSGQRIPLMRLEALLQAGQSGLVTLEGEAGNGVSTLLAHLANTRRMPFWFADADAGSGAAALAAQVIALYDLDVQVIPPATRIEATALEEVLATAATRTGDEPLILLIDMPTCSEQPRRSLPLLLPRVVPPGCLMVVGCQPDTPLPMPPIERIRLPQRGSGSLRDQSQLLLRLGCNSDAMMGLINNAQGNLLYLRLAHRMIQAGLLSIDDLHPGLDQLYAAWWRTLDDTAQALALLLAAAGEPLPLDLCADRLGTDPRPLLERWQALELVQLEATHVALAHWSLCGFVQQHAPAALHATHTQLAQAALYAFDTDGSLGNGEASGVSSSLDARGHYLARQFARHAALGMPASRTTMLPAVTRRAWVRAQERRTSSLLDAATDAAWELREAAATARTDPVRVVRAAILTGGLVSLSQTMLPDTATAALHTAVARLGREQGLRQVQALVEQLPDTHPKALVLRQIGEACYTLHMRTAAMRLLSQALDIEELKFPAVWHEQRDNLHSELARAALAAHAPELAYRIAHRIAHVERRGAMQTELVRWHLQQAQFAAARQLAASIEHTSMRVWAESEVAVRLARSGEGHAAAALLQTIALETARSWAEIELACDLAATDEEAARAHIERLPTAHQQDRGRARLAQALADANKDGDALDVAGRIQDVAVRVSALLDLRLRLEGLVAMLALEQATAVINRLPRDVRVPLVAMLAAAYAALGERKKAREVAEQLPTGEERDRALSRVAVALAQRGDIADSMAAARELGDPDERDWTLDELASLLAERGDWQQAHALVLEIGAPRERDRAAADLAIARAASDEPLAALDLIAALVVPDEYVRAISLAAPSLVAHGHQAAALALAQPESAPHLLSATQQSRYLATVATALADQGDTSAALDLIRQMIEPLDQARTRLAVARARMHTDPHEAMQTIGAALQVALHGRDNLFRILPQTTPVLAAAGGARLLDDISAAIEEIDRWA